MSEQREALKAQHQAVREMATLEGWRVLERFIVLMEENAKEQLATTDFLNLREVGRLQGTIHACRTIRGKVRGDIREALEDE